MRTVQRLRESRQRAFTHGQTPADLQCDIGAYELTQADSPTVIRSVSSATITTFGAALVGIQRDAPLILTVLFIATGLLWDTPLVYPIKIFVVMLHELGHALAAR